jgi:uncharacterized protein YegL
VLKAAVDKVQLSGGFHSHLGDALRHVRQFVFYDDDESPDKRPSDVTRVAVVITDGQSDDIEATAEQAAITKDFGIHLFAIGVGDSVDSKELEEIASQPKDYYMVQAVDFAALSGLYEELANKICTGQ